MNCKRITIKCGNSRRVLVLDPAEANGLKIGSPVKVRGDVRDYAVIKIEDSELIATPLRRVRERIPFVEVASFPVPTSDQDNQTIWKLLGEFRKHDVIFKRFIAKGREVYQARQDHACTARTIVEAIRNIE